MKASKTDGTLVVGGGAAAGSASQTWPLHVGFADDSGDTQNPKMIERKLRTSSMPYLYDIAVGNVVARTVGRALGYNTAIGTTLEDITGSGMANIPLPTTAVAMELLSSDAADDSVQLSAGTATGGSTTTLVDIGANFVGDGVAIGDAIINDELAELGLVSTVGATTLTVIDGFSGGNVGFSSGEAYRVIDADSAGDTGIKIVEVHGLDANWAEQSELVATNGVTPVALASNYIRVNSEHAMFVGSNGVAEGNVDVRITATPASIINRVGIGENRSLQCLLTVPAGMTLYLTDWLASASGTKPIRMILRATCDWDTRSLVPGVFQAQDIAILEGASARNEFLGPLSCPAKCDIKVSANALSVSGEGSASFGYWLE